MYQGKYTNNNTPRPSRRPAREETPREKKKIPSFYYIYSGCVALFLVIVSLALIPLHIWLVNFESSQPSHKRDEIFAELFADPDWEKVYTLSGAEDNAFENKITYAAYMEQLVGDRKLTCLETSAGLSGDKKFIIKLDDQKIAGFTLTENPNNKKSPWEMTVLELFTSGNQAVIVEKSPTQTIYINGIALDDSYTVRTISTPAEDYLPEGIHGYRVVQQQVSGLLTEPVVTVKNADGSLAAVTKNPETGIYEQSVSQQQPTTEEKELALKATQAYGKYMIKATNLTEIQKYFQTDSQFYATLRKSEVNWAQQGASYNFSDAVYSDYYRYNDNLFSINIDVTLNQVRLNGTVKEYPLKNTMFFQKNASGQWLVMEATNVNVQTIRQQVRVVFMNDETVLSDEMIATDANSISLPSVTAPEGQILKGWVKKGTDANGKPTLTVVFNATENNQVYLPESYVLEPMTLYPLFQEVQG